MLAQSEEIYDDANDREYLPSNASNREKLGGERERFDIECDPGMEFDVENLVHKMNARMKRWGQTVSIVKRTTVTKPGWLANIVRDEDGNLYNHNPKRVMVTKHVLTIESPVVAGTTAKLVGSFERAESGDLPYRYAFNGQDPAILDQFLDRWDYCDHCKTKRARNATFLCEKADGTHVVIGRQCSMDYLGLTALELLAREGIRKMLDSGGGSEDGEWGQFAPRLLYTDTIIKDSYAIAMRYGGYSRDMREKFQTDMAALRGAKFREAAEICKWYVENPPAKPLDLFALADFVYGMDGPFGTDLAIALASEKVREKRINLILAGVGMFVGRVQKRLRDQEEQKTAKLYPAGIGERVTFTGTVTTTSPYMGNYGPGVRIAILADDGSTCVHWSSKEENPAAGDRFSIKATIKKHDEGKLQTILTRAVYTPLASQE